MVKPGLFRRPLFIRLFNWEYWSFAMVYTWIYPVWLLLAVRARSLFFFSAANPSIKNGGFLGESKKDIHAIIPDHLYPRTIHFPVHTQAQVVLAALRKHEFVFPLVGKPDIGGRGRGVKILHSENEVGEYVTNCEVDFHIQQFVSFEREAGIFYYRYPGSENGCISGIVTKEFLSVTGDGIHTIGDLVKMNSRALLQWRSLQKMYGRKVDRVPAKGEKLVLVPYGNHARGAMFLDDSHLADEQLTRVIENLCRAIPEFYFGRLDIRFKDWASLRKGEDFSIIEVNGAGS